ncbi:MAG: RtcB family protein [Clostridiaceae bacterium]|mgnify:CR=1 FL=1|nr:RtcB family protein [Clostridiaceae bacterium]
MHIIKGKYNEAKVFTSELEETARAQIQNLVNQPFVAGSKIRIMPDVHAGAGSTIGTTMTITDKVVPNLVGVDIGCGMLTTELVDLTADDLDLPRLDRLIRACIPSGYEIRRRPHEFLERTRLDDLRCRDSGRNDNRLKMDRARRSLGTLGGGNHFIEVNRDQNGALYLVIHSGSRHLGLQVALHYQRMAARLQPKIERDLAYLEGKLLQDYLNDMKIMQDYAVQNRKAMAETIITGMDWQTGERFTTIHNYIDLDTMILRKGAISARAGEKVLIPLNMRDGSLLCVGKGNPDWNFSAPHGAGRIMSRNEAKRVLTLQDFRHSMEGVFSTSIRRDTLDEAPMAYKSLESLLEYLDQTVEILHHLTPVYNFKASGD